MKKNINLEKAKQILEGAEVYAKDVLHQPLCLAVVDTGGNLVALHRMDDGELTCIDYAVRKAFTAMDTRRPSSAREKELSQGWNLYAVEAESRVFYLRGGLPIIDEDGDCIGGVGAAGHVSEEDEKCVSAGLKYAGFTYEDFPAPKNRILFEEIHKESK